MALAFDTLKFTQRLEQVGVGREQAVAHAELARDMILADSATRADLQDVERALRSDIKAIKTEIEGSLRELELRMTVKLGAIIAAAVAVIAALQKFL
ncbi:CCDC90 family protein [Methylobacterium sp. J-072]|uniref:CCDC90 family protein n=1 Tax=Methylobacterium sp. J-072 TaxID=2836651 RepID=UPI001FBA085B|nr:CCDC90 family protein [Methylobacterium sp. J-072]MCJ2096161.1 CCDC90 family protein [Methylobacterium sp. J-072]